ncbi:MAG: NAD(P)H-dependent oxidoreductase subunit E [Bacteroidota bacterium]|nr:NAD(P)H-dependent oxidoreductase subunit E [Bacteroidota bacterium]
MKNAFPDSTDELEIGEIVYQDTMIDTVRDILKKYDHNPTRLMDILIDTQSEFGYIQPLIVAEISRQLNISNVDIEQTLSFYHFFSTKPTGKYTVYLNNSVIANMMGREDVARTFEREAGCKFGEVSADGLIGLFSTSCIGMSDQEPAALINGTVFTMLTPFRVKEIIRDLKGGKKLDEIIVEGLGDGANALPEINSMVHNNIRKKGPILADGYKPGEALKKIMKIKPEEVIAEVKLSNIRGRGGAGFPTGMKWEICRNAPSDEKYIFCNADEGEPGTFKDRVILTEYPKMLMEGMAIAGYAVGAKKGILYVRHEYKYLQEYLEKIIEGGRKKNYLGRNICGKEGFDFDIRIQFGAGAYVCGEESALIESAEGKRGEPRDRPPFPVESGYLQKPTIVNNVETLCSIVKIVNHGALWYRSMGTKESSGTKVISISGDCKYSGVYEIEWGFSVTDVLEMVGASDVQAVQVGGPSGTLIGQNEFNRTLSYTDLSTGGSIIIFNKQRDLIKDVVLNFTNFFIDESCGSCTTCRNIPVMLRQKLEKILNARGVQKDIEDMIEWAKVLKASRCGLGLTAANPIVTSIRNFRPLYDKKIQHGKEYDSNFDMLAAVKESCDAVGRVPNIHSN